MKCWVEEAQGGFKIARRNINNLRDADDTTLMTESEEELKSLFMKVKEESEKLDLKLNIQKMKIMEKKREFQKKKIYFCLIDYAKVFDYVYHNKLDPIRERSTSSLYIVTLLI